MSTATITLESAEFLKKKLEQLDREYKKKLEQLDREYKESKANLQAAWDALRGHREPIIEPAGKRYFLKRSGMPMQPYRAMRIILREHGGEMPTKELFDVMVDGKVFSGKTQKPYTSFRTSIHTNVDIGKIFQVSAGGENLKQTEIMDMPEDELLAGITRLNPLYVPPARRPFGVKKAEGED